MFLFIVNLRKTIR